MYNYFTYDDVRELIEDGVIRVNNDLKDMLKKGMKCYVCMEMSEQLSARAVILPLCPFYHDLL